VRLGLHGVERQALLTRAVIRLGGDAAGADVDTERTVELGRRAGVPQAVLPSLAIRVHVLVETGRTVEARPLAEEALDRVSGTSLAYAAGTEPRYVARCVGADRWLDALTTSSAWRTPWLEAITELLRGNPDRAVELYAALESPKDEAVARMEAARAHLAAGRRAEAEEHVEAALAFYREAGATRYVAEAEALLAVPAA
jgi:hypothetical protein